MAAVGEPLQRRRHPDGLGDLHHPRGHHSVGRGGDRGVHRQLERRGSGWRPSELCPSGTLVLPDQRCRDAGSCAQRVREPQHGPTERHRDRDGTQRGSTAAGDHRAPCASPSRRTSRPDPSHRRRQLLRHGAMEDEPERPGTSGLPARHRVLSARARTSRERGGGRPFRRTRCPMSSERCADGRRRGPAGATARRPGCVPVTAVGTGGRSEQHRSTP